MVVESFSLGGARASAPLAIGPADPYHWYDLSPDGRLAGVSAATNGPPPRITPPLRIWDIASRRILRTVSLQAQADNPPVFSPHDRKIALAVSVVSAVGYAYYPPSIMEIVDLANGRLLRLVGPACGLLRLDLVRVQLRQPAPGRCQRLRAARGLEHEHRPPRRTAGPVRVRQQHRARALQPERQTVGGRGLDQRRPGHDPRRSDRSNARRSDCPHPAGPRPAYSPDSALLATASIDHTVLIWDARTGQELRVLDHPDAANNVAFSPDSQSVATLDFDGTIRMWDACHACQNAKALLAAAEKRVTRQLTQYERHAFLRYQKRVSPETAQCVA